MPSSEIRRHTWHIWHDMPDLDCETVNFKLLTIQGITCQLHDSKHKYKYGNWNCVTVVDYSDVLKIELYNGIMH